LLSGLLNRHRPPYAVLLEHPQFGGFLFATAGKPGFLQLKVTDLLLVDKEGVGVDQVRAGG